MKNLVLLIGHIGGEVELQQLDNGTSLAKFSVATSESYKDKQGDWQNKTEWHNIVVWGKQAENANQILNKGNLVSIEGSIHTQKYQDKEGNNRYSTNIKCNKFTKLSKREQDVDNTNDLMPEGYDASKDDDMPF